MANLSNDDINENLQTEEPVFEYDEESADYLYTEETAYKRKISEVIDKEQRYDKEIYKLPKTRIMSQIEGTVRVKDEKNGIVLTGFQNNKRVYDFNRLYDVSGEKPVLIASGDVNYKNGMFIVYYPYKQECDDDGDYLKYIRSALYKLDKSNKPHFVANNVVQILDHGWFEQSTGKDYSVFLCKDFDNGSYKRIMNFGADMSGHREVKQDGTIIDELDRSDWYHKDEYKYDAEKNTLKFVKGEGYEGGRDSDDYDDFHETNPFKEGAPNLVIGDAEIYLWSDFYNDTCNLKIKDAKSGQIVFEKNSSLVDAFNISKKKCQSCRGF